ncbi:MAG: hypothetical protein ABGZ24_15180, partial [Fuerstiella sp.]
MSGIVAGNLLNKKQLKKSLKDTKYLGDIQKHFNIIGRRRRFIGSFRVFDIACVHVILIYLWPRDLNKTENRTHGIHLH